MNPRLPGRRAPKTSRFPAFLSGAALAFLFSLWGVAPAVHAAPNDTGVKVKPKITVIKPKVVKDKIHIVQYPVPARYATPFGIAVDSKNRIWCTLMSSNSVASLDPATGEFKEYRIPSAEGLPESDWEYSSKDRTTPKESFNVFSVGSPGNIIVDKNDTVWFVLNLGNSIVRFVPSTEVMTEFLLPTKNAQPYDLAEGPDGRIWFVEKNTAKFGYLDQKTRKIAEYKLPAGSNLMGITVDDGGVVWFSEVAGNFIGKYDPATKKMKQFLIPAANAQPGSMRFGEKGKLWFCAIHSRQIGILYTDKGQFGLVNVPGFNATPQAIAPAKDGKIWYVDSMMNMVGFFDQKATAWRSFEIPSHGAQPMNMALDSKGDVWFTESDRGVNQISKIIASSVSSAPAKDEPGTGAPSAPAGGHSH